VGHAGWGDRERRESRKRKQASYGGVSRQADVVEAKFVTSLVSKVEAGSTTMLGVAATAIIMLGKYT
jgi:hypothetical protein